MSWKQAILKPSASGAAETGIKRMMDEEGCKTFSNTSGSLRMRQLPGLATRILWHRAMDTEEKAIGRSVP